jgi:Protein of unknown function (DUF4054)
MERNQEIVAFKAHFPLLQDLSDPDVGLAIDAANIFLDANVWPSAVDFQAARWYWIAHWLTMSQRAAMGAELGGSGAIDLFLRGVRYEGKMVQYAQRTYGSESAKDISPTDASYFTTTYGQLFLQLRTRNIIPIAVI